MKTEKDFYPGWKITRPQWGRYWNMMTDCAEKLGISQDEARELVHIRAFGKNISAKLITHKDGFDELEKQWAAILDDTNIKRQLAKQDQPNVRIIHLIRHDFYRCLAVLLPIRYGHVRLPLTESTRGKCPNFHLADGYFKTILENRFKGQTIEQLDTIKRPSRPSHPSSPSREISELEQFRDTIARCISQARQKVGITEHELAVLADIECDCADCRAGIAPTLRTVMQPHHQKELAAATTENENPF